MDEAAARPDNTLPLAIAHTPGYVEGCTTSEHYPFFASLSLSVSCRLGMPALVPYLADA